MKFIKCVTVNIVNVKLNYYNVCYFQTLDISATADDQPELDRKYRVTLFNPGQGATLENNRTSCEVIVKENDAPYGFFQVFPTGFK